MTFLTDDRGASTTVTHALAIGISSLLVLTLLFGLGGFLDGQEKNAADRQVRVVSERVGTELSKAVRSAQGDVGTVRIRVSHPEQISGESYRISLEQWDCDGDSIREVGCVTIATQSTTSGRIPVNIDFEFDVEIVGTIQVADGGDFYIVVTPTPGDLEVTIEQ